MENMTEKPKIYSVDSSSLIQAWNVNQPPDLFPPFWEKLEGLIRKGIIICSEEVRHELEKKSDGVCDWIKKIDIFIPHDEDVQKAVRQILKSHPRLLNTKRNRSGADPFVIAVALVRKGSVITNELRSGKADKPKIPDVCDAYKISCKSLLEILREQYPGKSLT